MGAAHHQATKWLREGTFFCVSVFTPNCFIAVKNLHGGHVWYGCKPRQRLGPVRLRCSPLRQRSPCQRCAHAQHHTREQHHVVWLIYNGCAAKKEKQKFFRGVRQHDTGNFGQLELVLSEFFWGSCLVNLLWSCLCLCRSVFLSFVVWTTFLLSCLVQTKGREKIKRVFSKLETCRENRERNI